VIEVHDEQVTDEQFDDAYWSQLLDDAYRLQRERADDEDDDEEGDS
jgi:hypothetical protein